MVRAYASFVRSDAAARRLRRFSGCSTAFRGGGGCVVSVGPDAGQTRQRAQQSGRFGRNDHTTAQSTLATRTRPTRTAPSPMVCAAHVLMSTLSNNNSKDPFTVLGLRRPRMHHGDDPVTEEEVKHAFRQAAVRTHPDVGGTAKAFRAATDAYEECLRIVLARNNSAQQQRRRAHGRKVGGGGCEPLAAFVVLRC